MLLFQQLTLQLVLVFSTLPFMTRVRRLNACKNCLVCIVGVIAGGYYDQGRDLNAKLHDYYFIFNGFASKDSLPLAGLGGQLDAPSDWRPGGRGFNPCRGRQHSFVEIDHEIFSTVILSLPLIQEGQLSVSGERMCTILVNRLED